MTTLPIERFASEREAEKFEAEAEAANAQAEADRQKADASRLKEGAGGLYGYTKGTQRDVEASVRKAQRRAASVAKALYAKDERSVDFLKAHVKLANSKTARLILAAMKNLGPRVASEMLPSERHVARVAAEEKVAGGLYGYPTKTARLALVACSDLRAYVGEVAYNLHSRRTAKYAKMTGFLKEHGKTAKCAYSRMILDCYPDAPVSKEAKEKYPWPECIKDQEKEYGSKEIAEKVCGKIKSQSQGKSAADKKKVAPHMYVISKQGGRFMITRGDPKRSGSKMVFRSDDDRDVRDWLDDNKRKISKDHMIDLTGKFDIPAEYSDFYMKSQGKSAADQMLRKAFVPDSVDAWLEWEDGTRTAATRRRA